MTSHRPTQVVSPETKCFIAVDSAVQPNAFVVLDAVQQLGTSMSATRTGLDRHGSGCLRFVCLLAKKRHQTRG